jgi:predicted transcriptional regulator
MFDQIINKALIEFGLNDKEIAVYLACIEKEEQTPTQISRKTKIPRSSVYDIALGLALKGLLILRQSNGIEKQQTLINAVNPEKLRHIVQQKRIDLANLESDLLDAIPLMKHTYFSSKDKTGLTAVEFISGIDDFKKLYYGSDRHVPGQESYAWDSWLPVDTLGDDFGDFDVSNTVKNMKKYPHQQFEIISNNPRVRTAVGYHYKREPEYFSLIQHRYIENQLFELYNRIEIRGDHVYLFSSQLEEVYALIIRSKNFATSLKSIFLLQWMYATPLDEKILKNWQRESKEVWG